MLSHTGCCCGAGTSASSSSSGPYERHGKAIEPNGLHDPFEIAQPLAFASGSDSEESSVQYTHSAHSGSLDGSPSVEAFPSAASNNASNGRSWNEVLNMHPRAGSMPFADLDSLHFQAADNPFPLNQRLFSSSSASSSSSSSRMPEHSSSGDQNSMMQHHLDTLASAFDFTAPHAAIDPHEFGAPRLFADPALHQSTTQNQPHQPQHYHHHHHHHHHHQQDEPCPANQGSYRLPHQLNLGDLAPARAQNQDRYDADVPATGAPAEAAGQFSSRLASLSSDPTSSSAAPTATVEVYAVREDKRLMGFKSCYERRWNSRTRTKNLRCFPQCGPTSKHNAKGFCGCAIKGIVHMSSAPQSDLLAWAVLDLKESQKVTDFKRDGGISLERMRALERSKQHPRNEFLPCRVTADLANMASLYANEDHMGWDYRWTGHKHTSNVQHCLFMLVFQTDPSNPQWLQLVGIGETTPFRLTSARTVLRRRREQAETTSPTSSPPKENADAAEMGAPLPPSAASPSAPKASVHIKQEPKSRAGSSSDEGAAAPACCKRKNPASAETNAPAADPQRRVRLRAEARESLLRSVLEYCKRERVDALEKRRNRRYMMQTEIASRITGPIFCEAIKSSDFAESLLDMDHPLELGSMADVEDHISTSATSEFPGSGPASPRSDPDGAPLGRSHAASTASTAAVSLGGTPEPESSRSSPKRNMEDIVLSNMAIDQDLSQRLADFVAQSYEQSDDAELAARDPRKLAEDGLERKAALKLFRRFEVIIKSCIEDVIGEVRAGESSLEEDDINLLQQFQRSLISARNLARLDKRWHSIRVTYQYSLLSADWRMRKSPHTEYDDEFFQNLMCDKTGMFNKVVATALSRAMRQLAFKSHDGAITVRIGNGAVPMNLQAMYEFKTDGKEHDFPFDGPVLWFGELPKKTYVCTVENNDHGTLMLLNCTVRDAEGYCVGLLESIYVAYDRPDELIYRRSLYEFSSKPKLSRDVGSVWPLKYRDQFLGETVEVFDKVFSYAPPAVTSALL